jgi:acetyl-CoA/propionyl-CoA carboxylase, biotin carboxylase, biotin carboxyl carrier protein
MTDEVLTPREVAERLGVTVRTVQRWVTGGRLPATRVGGRMRVTRASLAAFLDSGIDAQHSAPRLRSLMIANRGEIAMRIAASARRAGIRVVGVHAADERPPDGADETHEVASYLDAGALLAIAARAGVDAIHPGYGFLAENAAFAAAVASAGLTWVGPPAAAIETMGDKASARRRATLEGVPVLPGYDGDQQDDATLTHHAEAVGFPLLVKPAAGGGGKGMRVVHDATGLQEALGAARREAQRSFADDRLILERFLEGPRHVEIQVLFDVHGAGVHLGERDCSAQRRNQKIVEESPGPSVSPELRDRMGHAALAVARSVGYVSAGTVEFLLADDGEFYFLEMNTRLQVEHPVTELVTGRDLVADQLRIAAGEPLGLEQAAIRLDGHAIEARLYAEDPEAGFLPATGRLLRVRWPTHPIRVDAGVREGDAVTDRYDPMLAKLIAHGRDRDEALETLRRGLYQTSVLGVRSNLRFLRWLLEQPFMRLGETRTDTISRAERPAPPVPPDGAWQAAAALLNGTGSDPWTCAWRLNAPAALRLRGADLERRVELSDRPPAQPVAVAGAGAAHVDVEGQSVEFRIASAPSVEEAVRSAATGGGGTGALLAPMPGQVIALRRGPGEAVEAHGVVVVIEAMKMEHAVVAPLAGTVTRVHVSEGQQVQRGDLLAEVTA